MANTTGKKYGGRSKGTPNKKVNKKSQLESLVHSFMNGNHYVYYHINEDTEEIFYIGKGKNNRAWGLDRSDLWKDYVSLNKYRVSILCSDISEEEALIIEESMIKLHKPLTNICHNKI